MNLSGVLGERGKGGKGSGWQVELGLREGERRGRWWPSRYGTAVKGDAAQDSAVFFNT